MHTSPLGKGRGQVVKATNLFSGAICAVKAVPKTKSQGDLVGSSFEINVMKRLDHQNIVKLFETFDDGTSTYLVMEHCAGGQMLDVVASEPRFRESDAALLMSQVLRAIRFLHKNNLRHGDLVPDNVLLLLQGAPSANVVKVADFGPLRSGQPALDDLLACGILLSALLSHVSPATTDGGAAASRKITRVASGSVFTPEGVHISVSRSARDLLRRLQASDPRARCSAGSALGHAWFRRMLPQTTTIEVPPALGQKICSFSSRRKLQRAALHMIADQLDGALLKPWCDLFAHLDRNQDGFLTTRELKHALAKAGRSIPKGLTRAMRQIDADGLGVLEFTAFVALMLDEDASLSDSTCRGAFCIFDRDGDGMVAQEEVELFLCQKELTGSIPFDKVADLIRQVDSDGDGAISFEEFAAMMRGNPVRPHPPVGKGKRVKAVPAVAFVCAADRTGVRAAKMEVLAAEARRRARHAIKASASLHSRKCKEDARRRGPAAYTVVATDGGNDDIANLEDLIDEDSADDHEELRDDTDSEDSLSRLSMVDHVSSQEVSSNRRIVCL